MVDVTVVKRSFEESNVNPRMDFEGLLSQSRTWSLLLENYLKLYPLPSDRKLQWIAPDLLLV